MDVLVIGAGEVGSAFSRVLGCDIRDVEDPEEIRQYDLLVICFGWFDGFEDAVRRHLRMHGHVNTGVLVASTVPVGTCDDNGWAHHLTRGRHPDLAESFIHDTHMISGPYRRAAEAFVEAGLRVSPVLGPAATTELAKLLELSQFGVEVRMMHKAKELCDRYGVDFDTVYGQAGRDYNALYDRIGFEKFHKPVLDFIPGSVGGHCVSPGLEMLGDEWFLQATEGFRSPGSAKGVAL